MDCNGQNHPEDALLRLDRFAHNLRNRPGEAGPHGEMVAALDELRVALDELRAAREALRLRDRQLDDAHTGLQVMRLRYRELFEFATDGYLITDRAGVIREANAAAVALFDRPRQFVLDRPLAFFLDRDDRWAFYTRLGRLGREDRTAEGWQARLKRDGRPRDVSLTVTILPGSGDEPAGLRWLLQDITHRRQAERALEAQKSLADTLVETARAAIVLLDGADRVVRHNPYLRFLTGHAEDELNGRDWVTTLVAAADQPAARELLWRLPATGAGETRVFRLLTRDGQERAVAWACKTLLDDDTKPMVLAIGQDVTELHDAQQQALQTARLAAIGQMMAGLTHESRNALQRSHACLERLSWRLHDRPEALDLLQRAQQAQNELTLLFEDVRLYAAPIRLDLARHDLATLWRDVWQEITTLHPARDAMLCEETATADLWLRADRFRLAQVFRNIFDNALAACADPCQVVVACTDAELAGRSALRIAVRDNGPGLGEEQRRRVFEPFYTTKTKGTGLGLAIARRVVEAHGGQITLGGAASTGAEILFFLPREPP